MSRGRPIVLASTICFILSYLGYRINIIDSSREDTRDIVRNLFGVIGLFFIILLEEELINDCIPCPSTSSSHD